MWKFFLSMWVVIGREYIEMVRCSIQKCHFPPWVVRRLITMLHKRGEKKKLINWRLIMLLNVTYKISTKTLQLRLQPILMGVISENQITFLLFRFILNNIFLTHEIISWAKKSKQPMLSFKLDFSKAYDKVEWMFLFESMFMIRIGKKIVNMSKLLYNGTTTSISLNGKTFETFVIKKGV